MMSFSSFIVQDMASFEKTHSLYIPYIFEEPDKYANHKNVFLKTFNTDNYTRKIITEDSKRCSLVVITAFSNNRICGLFLGLQKVVVKKG